MYYVCCTVRDFGWRNIYFANFLLGSHPARICANIFADFACLSQLQTHNTQEGSYFPIEWIVFDFGQHSIHIQWRKNIWPNSMNAWKIVNVLCSNLICSYSKSGNIFPHATTCLTRRVTAEITVDLFEWTRTIFMLKTLGTFTSHTPIPAHLIMCNFRTGVSIVSFHPFAVDLSIIF